MKKNIINLEEIKQKIQGLKGSSVKMEINRGRNKIVFFEGIVVRVYPSVFTVENKAENNPNSRTFSYFDVLCGDVKIVANN